MPDKESSNIGWHLSSLVRLAMLLAVAVWLGLALQANAGPAGSLFQSPATSPFPAGPLPPTPTPAPALPRPRPSGPTSSLATVGWVIVGLAVFGPLAAGIVWFGQRASSTDES
ncbi:MAG: hypothetical protein ACE5H9_20555 [Anaerolineae bacterium]